MRRDMDLIRKILLIIEEQFIDVALYNIKIEDYDPKTIAYHCSILHDAGLIDDFNKLFDEFGVGRLTWEGHEFIDKIRNDNTWNKTTTIMKEKGLPFALDVVKQIASAVVNEATKVAIKSMM